MLTSFYVRNKWLCQVIFITIKLVEHKTRKSIQQSLREQLYAYLAGRVYNNSRVISNTATLLGDEMVPGFGSSQCMK